MKVFKIDVENYRLLKSFSIDLEEQLSLILGKNNTGKTSILSILDKFLNQPDNLRFSIDDFNLEYKKSLKAIIENTTVITETDYKEDGIKLKLFIDYNEKDDLSNLSRVMMDLDPTNNVIILSFEYSLAYIDYLKVRNDYNEFKVAEGLKVTANPNYKERGILYFLKQNHALYFDLSKKSYEFDIVNNVVVDSNFIDLLKEDISIKEIINFKYISAKRDVTNKEIDKTLSKQTSRIYKRTEVNDEQKNAVSAFQDTLSITDNSLTTIYSDLFKGVVEKIKTFGGVKINESEIEIVSTLQHRELLEGNTTVVYKHDADNQLPEHYNGLGYMNLISMIFEIEILVQEFKREKEKKPADINLLFIEEPEAHTHPQMQYVFIKNIKKLLAAGIERQDGINRRLQYFISTHSSHIVADSDFSDIKYLKKAGANEVISKNLKDLEKEYSGDDTEKQNFKFLKQYLTLNRAELFFADKVIFIEGATERILLPAMMRKIDNEYPTNPILSQNISIVEVGAHSHIFEKFIEFIGINKSVIITDIDSYYLEPVFEADGATQKKYPSNGNLVFTEVKCPANHPSVSNTSNSSLKFFHSGINDINYFKSLSLNWKILRKNKHKKWVSNKKGSLLLIFQIAEGAYHPRSFEDAFFCLNKAFITNPVKSFPSLTLKHLEAYRLGTIDDFIFSEKAVGSKPSLAIEILLNSETNAAGHEFSNWQIPAYLKEGLLWLKQD
jgi:predicted ATP-dependent endonuclease of OLD family